MSINTIHLNNNLMTKIAQLLNNNLIAYKLNIFIFQESISTQNFNDFKVCKQFNGIIA